MNAIWSAVSRALALVVMIVPVAGAELPSLRFQCDPSGGQGDACPSFSEEFREDGAVNVRGRVVAGLRITGEVAPEPTINARVVDGGTRELCVRLITSDGLYSAEVALAALEPDQLPPGNAELLYPLDQSRALLKYRRHVGDAVDAATLITPGDCAPRRIDTVLVGYWGGAREPGPLRLEVLVNSLGASEVRLNWATDEDMHAVRCERLADGRRVGFDFTCGLTVREGIDRIQVNLALRDLGLVTGRTGFTAILP